MCGTIVAAVVTEGGTAYGTSETGCLSRGPEIAGDQHVDSSGFGWRAEIEGAALQLSTFTLQLAIFVFYFHPDIMNPFKNLEGATPGLY